MQQMSLSFEPGLSRRHRSLRELCAVQMHASGLMHVAARIDTSPTHLGEKLAGASSDGKPRCLNVDELEKYITEFQDYSPIFYLLDKFLSDPEARQQEALAKLASIAEHIPSLLAAAGLPVQVSGARAPRAARRR